MKTIAKQPEDVIQDTKKYIVDTARQFFSEYSYLGVSMSDIAKKLDITKAALYYHFTGKAEIYEKVLDEVFDDLSLAITEAMNETTIDKKLHKLIKNYLEFGFREKNLIKSIVLKLSPADRQITKHITQLRERVADLIQPIIEEAFASKKLTGKVDSQLLTSMLTGMMDGLLLEYSFLNKKINSAKISDQIIAALF
ncbi:MAG TPA: TetR/AcrR family transcriptional regulator [Candidatus Moranbacteria bacterium]|jgi:AcrR family transcriptional regulator|nr:TetR/AcrR family transcriptional regulator [Candidatus Moranbacteria bacterium]HSA08672.1 TetR/AcrR family transcriptional regulator [Candidatus Moranbacteria bacterium]